MKTWAKWTLGVLGVLLVLGLMGSYTEDTEQQEATEVSPSQGGQEEAPEPAPEPQPEPAPEPQPEPEPRLDEREGYIDLLINVSGDSSQTLSNAESTIDDLLVGEITAEEAADQMEEHRQDAEETHQELREADPPEDFEETHRWMVIATGKTEEGLNHAQMCIEEEDPANCEIAIAAFEEAALAFEQSEKNLPSG